MSVPTEQAEPFDHVTDLGRYNAEHDPRTPPGESFPPYMPKVGDEPPDAAAARLAHELSGLASTMRSYLGMMAQREAPQNEQVYQNGGTLLNGLPLDLDLGQVPLNLFARAHRLVVTGVAADVVTVTLYMDGAGAVGNAVATWNLPALNADGVVMVEPDRLNLPKGRRIIARVRAGTSVNPIYVALFTRSYPA